MIMSQVLPRDMSAGASETKKCIDDVQITTQFIFLPKFHCKLNPIEIVYSFLFISIYLANSCIQYWGWCKKCYRDVPKINLMWQSGRARMS